MPGFSRKSAFPIAASLASAVLWGILEFIALQRVRLSDFRAWDRQHSR